MPLRLRRGTNTERITFTPAEGELIYITDTKQVFIGDGTTIGGNLITSGGGGGNLSGPLLGDIDLNTHNISGIGSISATGGFHGNLHGSVYADDSTILVNTANSTISNGTLTLNGTFITSNFKLFSEFGNPIGILNISNWDDPTQIQRIWDEPITPLNNLIGRTNGTDALVEKHYTHRGQFTSLEAVLQGDVLSKYDFFGHDGSDFFKSCSVIYSADPHYPPSPGSIPGSVGIVTEGDLGTNVLSFNSRGFLSINRYPEIAREALDVNGNAIFSGNVTATTFTGDVLAADSNLLVDSETGSLHGRVITATDFIQFGPLTTTQRNDLFPFDGMIIYNTTVHKFQGCQNGVWINLDDGSAA